MIGLGAEGVLSIDSAIIQPVCNTDSVLPGNAKKKKMLFSPEYKIE